MRRAAIAAAIFLASCVGGGAAIGSSRSRIVTADIESIVAGDSGPGVPDAFQISTCQADWANEMIYDPSTDTWTCES